MQVLMVRSTVRQDSVPEVEAAIQKVFAAIEQARPDGVRYASGKLADGVTFVALVELEDGIENPLPALPAFVQFQSDLKQWIDEPPTGEHLTVIGSYRLF